MHEGHLAGYVKVVRAGGGAGGEGGLAKGAIRSNGREEDEGPAAEGVKVGGGDDFDGGRGAVWVEFLKARDNGFELRAGAARHGPFEGGGEVGGDVLGCVFAGVA